MENKHKLNKGDSTRRDALTCTRRAAHPHENEHATRTITPMSDQTQINCRACGEPMDYVTWDWNGRDMSIVTCRNESCACAGATFTAASYASKDLRPYGYQGN